MTDMRPGLFDKLIDELMGRQLDAVSRQRLVADIQDVDPAELPDRLGEVVGQWAHDALASIGVDRRAEAAIALSKAALAAIASLEPNAIAPDRALVAPIRRLAAVETLAPTDEPVPIRRPLTPLRDTVLMTNARDQPAVGREIEAEIDSADRIDLVLAFIRWTGIRHLLPHLRRHVEAGKPLRIITTTYTGSTELRALQALAEIGAEVQVSYDTSTTRLHAKAWLFQRSSGFSTVYIGSSNLTFSAQVTGLEWNVRASQRLNPELIAAFERTFATYWADPHFEPFDAEHFRRAMATSDTDDSIVTPFEIEPYPFQRQILERLQVERRKGHPHNLIAAATGTGKTIMAALDYRALRSELDRARLLFVAHRSEILQQSQATFRHVLRDGAFGELWVGGNRPQAWDHVFASIQSITANEATSVEPEQFDVVIVDEFHHSAATSYEALLDHLRPKHLLGLTATPERTDGLDVLRWFGGKISVELRLWDALEQGLLSPFHYFGIHDATDLSAVTWRRGRGYDTRELTNVYTGDDVWASKVLGAVEDKVGDPKRMRALGFCVSIEHAKFMADRFNRAGVPSLSITSETSESDRRRAITDLGEGNVNVLFTVDLFNEGVDIPDVDVLLMLRPTESATVFLQQLGRGLRRSAGKDVLTVLDFVGHQSKQFRFDLRYRRLLGRSRRQLESDVQQGFPYLPAGCHIDLDGVARDIVLRNIREALPTTWKQRVQELRELGDIPLSEFLHQTGLELDDMYRNGRTWTELRRAAGIDFGTMAEGEPKAGRGLARLLHVDDQDRLDTYIGLLNSETPPAAADLDVESRRQFEGLLLTVLNPRKNTYRDLDEAIADLWQHGGLRKELVEMLPLLGDQISHLHKPLRLEAAVPLQVHANYTREEILAAFGASTVTRPLPLQTGVYWHEATRTDLLFITLQKAEKDYSPSTRYLDYAISDRLFHWESQAKDTVASERGQNYIHHLARDRSVVLFIRASKQDPTGRTMPYFCAGTARYVEHRSERPIQITWRLDDPLPGGTFVDYRAAVA
jgi:superfamily II DNA or RNA helicase